MRIAYIGLFGLIGVFARYGIGLLGGRYSSQSFVATLIINIVGSFLIGAVYAAGIETSVIPEDLRIGMTVGLLGGFTTFSAYSLETFVLANQSQYLLAAAYFVLSPCLGLLATIAGVILCRYGLRG